MGRGVTDAGQERRQGEHGREYGDHRHRRQLGDGQGEPGTDQATEGPGCVEGRQDRPPHVPLHGHRLHVARRIDDAQADAVDGQACDEDDVRRGQGHRHGASRDDHHAGAQHRPAVVAPGECLGDRGPKAGEQHHPQQQPGELDLADAPGLLDPRQPRGEADEDQALGSEGTGHGGAGAAGGGSGGHD
ncbi:hypothetical protein Q9R27_08960 [Nocardioides sp. AE5]|nr:hypothetical protein [Nocardioides sp. AE5]MDT0202079.1 hypothetical protein [Nocardioides sp. AE5]